MQPERGDVVRSTDPFKLGADRQRPWLIISDDAHPFDDSLALDPNVWRTGGVPRDSFVSPWAVHSPRTEDLVAWQGRITTGFVDRVVDALASYID